MKNREVLILTTKINKIFEKVYSVNESLSSEERNQLTQGFEDGINELFGFAGKLAAKAKNLVSDMGQKAKQAYNDMVQKGKSYYEKGKELAGQAWDAMQKFSSDVVNKVKSAFSAASELVVSNYMSFKNKIVIAYQESLATISEAYAKMKEKGEAFVETCKGIWTDILEETSLLIQSCKEKMLATKEGISKWLETNKQELDKNIEAAKASTIDTIKVLGDKVKSALEKGKQVAGDVLSISVFVCVFPMIKLIEGVKAIPGVYDSSVKIAKEFIAKELEEIKSEYAKELAKKESFKYLKTFENFKY